jgi:hypothetical protein
MSLMRLGEGMMLLYRSDELIQNDQAAKYQFWQKIISFMNIQHLQLKADYLPLFFWSSRVSGPQELSYKEVRRLSLFNLERQTCRFFVTGTKQFAFLRLVDPHEVQVKNTPLGLQVEIQAGGFLNLDYGYFEG